MSLHIHSGDSAAITAAKVIPGQHLAWTDNLFEGPLPKADWNDLAWYEARSAALADYLGGKELASQRIASRYYVIREALNCECEVTLWFDSCLYDMMLLCEFLTFTKNIIREDSVIYLICEEVRDDGSRFAGYGELNEDEIQAMMKRRKLVTPAMRAEAEKAWEAFTSPDPHAWQEAAKATYELTPFLTPAFERLLEQLPNSLGFNRLEMEIMYSIMDGCSEPMPMFKHVSEQEERPYFGDTVFYKALNRLATARQPMIRFFGPAKLLPLDVYPEKNAPAFHEEDWRVTMSLAGMRAVWGVGQGKGGFYDDTRWVANVKLSPDDDWRYDPKQKKLYKKEYKTMSSLKIEDALLTKNPCYKTGRKIEVKGLMLHSVGCTQPHAMAFVKSWNSPDYERACVHGFIDAETGVVYQTLPWAHRGWHGASGPNGSVNNTHVGVEMCESGSLKYTHGATFECSNPEEAKTMAKRTFDAAVELFAYLCKKYRLDPLEDGVIISHKEGHDRGVASGHVDPEHLWTQLNLPLSMDVFRKAVKAKLDSGDVYCDEYPTNLQAKDLADLSEEAIVEKVGPLFTADHRAYGVMAAVSMAQFILESAYGKSELAQNANNCFGMKKMLSGNCWGGSAWDSESFYTKKTTEEYKVGEISIITADFRKYPCIEASIADHSAYLLGAKNGDKLRYEGIAELTDYKAVAQCIKDGGYATSSTYVEKLCRIIEKWDLTRFNFVSEDLENQKPRVLEA